MAEETRIIKPQEGFQQKFTRCNTDVAIGGGVLNPQPADSLVATPKGFVKIQDLKAGDIICDAKGGVQKVNFVLDKGLKPCVEFILSDNRIVQSSLDHNWYVKNNKGIYKRLEAKDIISYIEQQEQNRKTKVNRLRIPLSAPVKLDNDNDLPLHPYIVGYLLGNGCVSDKSHDIYISTMDMEIVDKFRSLGLNIVKGNKKDNECLHYAIREKWFKQKLKDSGIYGMVSYNKRIPKQYLFASVEDRFELLKGLFDSDGCSSKHYGQVSYTTTSEGLKDDVLSLVHSLGGIANYSENEEYQCYIKGKLYDCRKSYVIRCRLWNDKDFFSLKRKKDIAIDNRLGRNAVMLGIKSYRYIGEKHCYCINVDDNDHLYLTDNYVITCNCGKSFAAILSIAESSDDPNFRALFLRNNLGDARASGGLLDTFKEIYGSAVDVVESGEPRVTFKHSGCKIDVTHVSDQSREKVRQRFKGRQYDYIYFDEMTGFSWDCFTEICTRNRGTGKWTGKIRGTTNPDRNHWLRTFLDWYIGVDGFIREDRDGVVRYFYINGESVKDVVWGDSKEEVYQKCKIDIDRKVSRINGKTGTTTYKDLIRSFVFYLGRMSENKASLGNNSGYVGAVAMSGGRSAEQLLEGNWNVSPDDEANACLTSSEANQVFMNDPAINGDRWVTCDLADVGTDNFVALCWNGFHIEDILILNHTTPRENAEYLQMFAKDHDIPDNRIIYDGVRGLYINDYIPDAEPFISNKQTKGIYGRMYRYLKDECYARLVEAIKRGNFSMSDDVARKIYQHQRLKINATVQNEFIEECLVISFKEVLGGKKALLSKKEMNAKLGKERSMDLLDPCAMRMLPVLEYPYGEELSRTIPLNDDDDDDYYNWSKESIFETSSWY